MIPSVQQSVRFVQDEELDSAQAQLPALHQILYSACIKGCNPMHAADNAICREKQGEFQLTLSKHVGIKSGAILTRRRYASNEHFGRRVIAETHICRLSGVHQGKDIVRDPYLGSLSLYECPLAAVAWLPLDQCHPR